MLDIIKTGGIKEYLADLLYPNRCPFCDKFIEYNILCCEECFNKALWADENICIRCGKPLVKGCLCGEKELYYDLCVPAAYYLDETKEAVLALKYKKSVGAAELYGRVLRDRLIALELIDKIDAAVPVPMTKKQKYSRGYNQSERLARAVMKGTNIPVYPDMLIRKNVKVAQHKLDAKGRAAAVSGQYFAAEGRSLKDKTVALVDDVLTTGSTLSYCAYLLKEKLGAEMVICLVCTTV